MRARRPCTGRRLENSTGCRTGPRKGGSRTPLGRCPFKQPGLISKCSGIRDWSLAVGRNGVCTIHCARGRGGWWTGVDSPRLPSSVLSFWKEVGGTSLPYPERKSHPLLHDGLTRFARPLHRSAGEVRQRTKERVNRDLQGYPHKVSERSGSLVVSAE